MSTRCRAICQFAVWYAPPRQHVTLHVESLPAVSGPCPPAYAARVCVQVCVARSGAVGQILRPNKLHPAPPADFNLSKIMAAENKTSSLAAMNPRWLVGAPSLCPWTLPAPRL